MKIFDYEIKNKSLALIGILVFITILFIPEDYGSITRIFCGILGFIFIGISTGNRKFISEVKALFIIVIIALKRSIGEKFLKMGRLLNYQEKKMMFSVLQNLRIKYVLWENWMLKFIR